MAAVPFFILGFRAGFKNFKPTYMHVAEYMRGYREGQRRRNESIID